MGILSILKSMFTSSKSEETAKQSKNHSISRSFFPYNASLVDQLKQEHQNIFGIYTEIKDAAEAGNFDLAIGHLKNFRMALLKHVGLENQQFYVYLRNKLSSNPERMNFVARVKDEMDGVASFVGNFAKKYNSEQLKKPEMQKQFLVELAKVGDTLTTRVDMEEKSLYSLYTP